VSGAPVREPVRRWLRVCGRGAPFAATNAVEVMPVPRPGSVRHGVGPARGPATAERTECASTTHTIRTPAAGIVANGAITLAIVVSGG
jgi:hypothetical protein